MSAPTPPTLPSFTDKTTFFTLAQGLFVWLTTTFMTWVNDTATAMNLNSTNDVSSTSVLIGAGTKSLTASASKSYVGGMYVVISDNTTPGTSNSVNSMTAQVTSYNISTGAMVVNVLKILGSGTKTAWVISQCAMPSLDVSITMQTVTTQTTLAAGRTALDVYSKAETDALDAVKLGMQYMQVQDQRGSGTAGGAAISGVNNRTLNTVVTNTITGASVASSVITLPAGTYRFRGESMVVADTAASHVTPQLYNNTVGAVALLGLRTYLGVGTANAAWVSGRFTLNATTALLLRTQFSAANAAGLGLAASFGTTEVYSNVEIWKE